VDVGRWRVLEDAAHQVGMLVTHDEAPSVRNLNILLACELFSVFSAQRFVINEMWS